MEEGAVRLSGGGLDPSDGRAENAGRSNETPTDRREPPK